MEGARPRVLLTRPADRSAKLAADLANSGVEALIWPLLDPHPTLTAPPHLGDAQAVVLTSARAAEALPGPLPLPVFCVGDATARAAHQRGFSDVRTAGGDADDLSLLIRQSLSPANGPLLYLRGHDIARDIRELLTGFTVREVVTYRAHVATKTPETITKSVSEGEVAVAAFFSPRTAAIFSDIASADMRAGLSGTVAVVMSKRVANALDQTMFKDVIIASAPTGAAMHAAICGACDTAPPQDRVCD